MYLLQQSTHRMVIRHHPAIGHLYVPNLKARLHNEEGGYFLVTNSLGFRSNQDFECRRGAKPRILMFGDSYTAGDNCANEERYSDQLAGLLDAEVYNYGLSGSGTDQHLLIYREFAREVAADLIVLCVQLDSIERIQLSHRPSIDRITRQQVLVPKPYFELKNGELVLRQVPVPRERPAVGSIDLKTTKGSRKNGDLKGRLIRALNENEQLSHLLGWTGKTFPQLKSELYRMSGAQPYPDLKSPDSHGWKLMKAIIEQFIREVAPIPVMIVPIPTYEYYLHGARPIYQPLFQSLEKRERGVHVLDVSTPLVSLPWTTRQKVGFRIGHFTAFGHDQVATMMEKLIRGRSLLPQLTKGTVGESAGRTAGKQRSRKSDGKYVLGISCFYHNSAACLIRDGRIMAAAEEERFTRQKNDRRFPHYAINYCLEEGGINQTDLSAVVYYDNPAMTFERILHSQLAEGEKAESMWLRAMPGWIRYKLHVGQLIRKYLRYEGLVLQAFHHRSHCASAFYPSPFQRAAILTVDGVGEWATASISAGCDDKISILQEMRFPHSVGLLYSAFTQFTGFKVNSGEYKMMGLAPYGEPTYVRTILDHLIDLKKDGSIELNLKYFGFLQEQSMTNDAFATLFGGPPRLPDSRISKREMDLAHSIQVVTEEAILRMARHAYDLTGEKFLCMSGGVALNCVANGRLLREGPFKDIWIQPAAGDSGSALGAAMDAYHTYFGKKREVPQCQRSSQGGSYWGPAFSDSEIQSYLDTQGYPYRKLNEEERADYLARAIEAGEIVGHLSGRMEYGPRALGARSILGDARNVTMQTDLNLKIKYRESFRPFAPSVLAERVSDYFELDRESPYMLIVAPVRKERQLPTEGVLGEDMLPIVRQVRSDLPAITHVDYSARIQTVVREDHPAYFDLIRQFDFRTGCAVIVNTSFNVRGEPIVCTPADAYRCFMRTEMNLLALGNFVLLKEEQPSWPEGQAEGLESEDATRVEQTTQPEGLLRELKTLFKEDFLPLVRELKGKNRVLVNVDFSQAPSMWTPLRETLSVKEWFEIPLELDVPNPDPVKLADVLMKFWVPGPATEAARPLLIKLLELGLRFPAQDALEEQVSESVYVMF